LLPRSVRVLVRRRRWTGAASPIALAEAAWAELRDSALDLGLVWDDSVTLRTRARDLVRSFGKPHDDALGRSASRGPRANPEAAQALDRIVRLVERARFARALPTEADLDGLRTQLLSDVGVCVDAIRAAASAQRRTWAAWLPASLVYGFSVAGPRRGTARIDVGEAGIDHAV
jgi:hypothetical protein